MAENNPELNQQMDPEIQLRQASVAQGQSVPVLRRGIRAVFIGPERSGKAEQGTKLAKKYCVCYLNTKQMLQAEAKSGSPLAQKLQGGEADADTVLQVFEKNLETPECKFGFILDGFPRNISEAKKFDDFLTKRKTVLDTVVEFGQPDKWIFTGLLNSKSQVGKYYSKKSAYTSIDSTKPFSQVASKIDELFAKYVTNDRKSYSMSSTH
uniref:Adenylate kinase n=1 Tax=Panagrolaimus superbus TaxID=310955 RepID=A0A914YRK9_9BILA